MDPTQQAIETLTKEGFTEVASADSSEATNYYVKSSGVYTTPYVDAGQSQELVGIRLDIAPDPASSAGAAIDADEFSADNNNVLLNGQFESADAPYISRVCGSYAPIEKAAQAAGLATNENLSGNAVDVYEITSETTTFKACLIYEDDPGVVTHHVWFDTQVESDFNSTVPSKDGITIWSGKSLAVGSPVARRTLGSWSGDSSRLIRVPGSDQQGGKFCWSFTGDGNHILQLEDDTAGSGLVLLTNTVGGTDSDCTTTELSAYIQVLAEGHWQLTLTNF